MLISLADTWLHLATNTVEITQFQANNPPQSTFGRGLNQFCINNITDGCFPDRCPCTLEGVLGALRLIGGAEAYKTLSNISTIHRLLTAYDSGKHYALLGDVHVAIRIALCNLRGEKPWLA